MKKFTKHSLVLGLALSSTISLTGLSLFAAGPTPVNLLSATNFAILAGSTITNIGSSVVNGDMGLSPGSSITGFPPGILNGTQHINNATVIQAQNDLVTAFNAANQTPVSVVPAELGGTTRIAGVYESMDGSFAITGALILDGQNDPNSVFIFKSASTLTTAGASSIVLVNGAQACNIIWQVGSSATLGTNSVFKGTIISLTSATITTGANVEGRVLARNGAVTLDSSTITRPVCFVPPVPVITPIVTATTTVTATTSPILTATSTPIIFATTTVAVIPPTATSTTTPLFSVSPQFPNAGMSPEETSRYWGILTLVASLFSTSLLITHLQKRQLLR